MTLSYHVSWDMTRLPNWSFVTVANFVCTELANTEFDTSSQNIEYSFNILSHLVIHWCYLLLKLPHFSTNLMSQLLLSKNQKLTLHTLLYLTE